MLKNILIIGLLTNLLLSANTIKCLNQPIGSTITIDNKEYFVANNKNIKKKINDDFPLELICTSNVTNMNNLFRDSKFNGDLSSWDVSNVENMIGMFQESKFNGDLSNWNTSNVINMESMFTYSKFNNDSFKKLEYF